MTEGILGEHLARIGLQMGRDCAEKDYPKFALLLFAHTSDPGKLPVVCRIKACHLPQRNVGEDNVGRHATFVGELLPQFAQILEQHFVACDFTRTMPHWPGRRNRFGELDFLARPERSPPAVGQFKESDDVGRSLSSDRRKKAKTTAKPGQGDKGDRKR